MLSFERMSGINSLSSMANELGVACKLAPINFYPLFPNNPIQFSNTASSSGTGDDGMRGRKKARRIIIEGMERILKGDSKRLIQPQSNGHYRIHHNQHLPQNVFV